MMTPCIILICGPPACLKSTLIQIFRLMFSHEHILNLEYVCIKKLFSQRNEIEKLQYNFLSFDDLFSGYENEMIQNWKLYRSLIADEIERIIISSKTSNDFSSDLKYSSQILQRLNQSLENSNNRILIIEDNFYYSSMRHRYCQIAQRAQIGFTSIHLYSNLSIALERNRKREISKRVSDLSIENIYSKYEFSNEDLVINTTDRGLTGEHINKILQRIEQACQEPMNNIINDEQRQLATEINQKNLIYQIDQRLRKFISKYLVEEFSKKEKFQIANEKKNYAEKINDRRQKFLELIKQKFILLNDSNDIEHIFERFLHENK